MTRPEPPELPALVAPHELHEVLHHPGLRVLDATTHLDRPPGGGPYQVRSGAEDFAAGHVPGAVHVHVGALRDPASPLPFALPDPHDLATAVAGLGVDDAAHVVVYSANSPMWATRLWWLLRWAGHGRVSVLDGGLPGWRAAGLATATGPVTPRPGTFTAQVRTGLLAELGEVEQLVLTGASCTADAPGAPGASGVAGASGGTGDHRAAPVVVNTLSPAVFRGEGVTSYSRPGRLPGSVNLPWTVLVDPGTHRWRSEGELSEVLDAVLPPGRAVVAHCGGGVSATTLVFAAHLLARPPVRLYAGSLAEWSARPDLPLVTG